MALCGISGLSSFGGFDGNCSHFHWRQEILSTETLYEKSQPEILEKSKFEDREKPWVKAVFSQLDYQKFDANTRMLILSKTLLMLQICWMADWWIK